MFKLLMAVACAGGCGQVADKPADPAPVADCAPGIEVVVWFDQPTPCDLDGSQTLTELGLPNEAACDDRGGEWVYEACVGRDY